MIITRHETGPRLSQAVVHGDTVYLASDMNSVWDAWVEPKNTPARATVEARLATPKYLVEIMVTAAL